ncbi:MAG: hypothetical protein MUE54_11655 [Anaerolineae bacterium]|jgi:hypothetical protein|nr:hypothetical protein [Anaerolineae bacterium]
MPAVDTCQPQVIRALEKDGWRINYTHVRLVEGNRLIMLDIQASYSANGGSRQILLAEIKCFANSTEYSRDLYVAIGQYLIYQEVLNGLNDSTPLYLAIPIHAYRVVFDEVALRVINRVKMKMIVVDIEQEVIVEWKE